MTDVQKLAGTRGDDVLIQPEETADIWRLLGSDGDDILIDGPGQTHLQGGEGADIFVFGQDDAENLIRDFDVREDKIDLSAWGVWEMRQIEPIRSNKVGAQISFDGNLITIQGQHNQRLSEDNFIFAGASEPLPVRMTLSDNGYRLVLPTGADMDGIGNDGDNRLTGNDHANVLEGRAGRDVLLGEGGDDLLIDGAGADYLSGDDGADIYKFVRDGERDSIEDFESGIDKIDVSDWGVSTFADLSFEHGSWIQHSSGVWLRSLTVLYEDEELYVGRSPSFANYLTPEDFNLPRVTAASTLHGWVRGSRHDETIRDSGGRNMLYGGGGEDVFELMADGQIDNIKDFGDEDRIDVTAWGVTAFEDLSIAAHHSGKAFVRYGEEVLAVRAVEGAASDLLTEGHFLFG